MTLEHNFRNFESQIHLVCIREGGIKKLYLKIKLYTKVVNKTFKIQLSPNVNSFRTEIIVQDNLYLTTYLIQRPDSYIKEHHNSYGKREETD